MALTDFRQKMRATFAATLPDEDAALRRIADRRAARVGTGRIATPTVKRVPAGFAGISLPLQLGLGFAGIVLVFVVLRSWHLPQESVPIEPSLARDLESAPRPKPVPEELETASPFDADADTDNRALEAKKAPMPSRPALKSTQGSNAVSGADPPNDKATSQADVNARWARVTDAMRKQDWTTAKTALEPLIASTDPETKDGARLVRIRLELGATAGTLSSSLLAELSDLATAGSTSSIRASARRLLESLPNDSTKREVEHRELPSKVD